MAPKDFTDSLTSAFMHEDDHVSCSSCEDTEIRQKKSVHFNPSCQLKLYSMPSQEDRANAWYDAADYQQFKSISKAVAKAARQGNTITGEDMTFGLEAGDKKRSELKTQRRYTVWDLVLDGQEDNQSPIEIAGHCSKISDASARDAVRTATLLHVSLLHDELVASRKIVPQKPLLSIRRVQTPISRVA